MTHKNNRFDKLAEYLAEQYVSTQEEKTAASPTNTKTPWDYLRPENPDRPGANWWTGLGTGAMAAGAEFGVGKHGLTESVHRYLDRGNLARNPLERFETDAFQKSITGNEQAKYLHELFKRQAHSRDGNRAIGELLAGNYGKINVNDPAAVSKIHGNLSKLVAGTDPDMAEKFKKLTTTGAASNADRGKRILDSLDTLLTTDAARIKPRLSPQEVNLLTKLRTSVSGVKSADELDALTRSVRNLAASVKGGKKGTPTSLVFGDQMRKVLNTLGKAPVDTQAVADPAKIKSLVTALGQFTKDRKIPSVWRRLGRGGTAAGIGTAIGAYLLPSAMDFAKSNTGTTTK